MSRAEEVFYPVILFLEFLSYFWLFSHMLPAMTAAALLGWFDSRAVLPRLAGVRFTNSRCWTLAAILWDLTALALSVFLGCLNGWWLLYTRVWGGCLTLAVYLLVRILSAVLHKKHEEE